MVFVEPLPAIENFLNFLVDNPKIRAYGCTVCRGAAYVFATRVPDSFFSLCQSASANTYRFPSALSFLWL